jgi:hypothetical protein
MKVGNHQDFTGVISREDGKFQAQIFIGTELHVDKEVYDTPEEAARAYDRLSLLYLGDYGTTHVNYGLLPETIAYRDTKKFVEVFREIFELARGRKTEDYGRTYAETGVIGIYIKLMIKVGRLRQLVWEGKKPKNESTRDTLLDIAAYAIYGVICLDENNIVGNFEEKDELLMRIMEELK